MTPATLRKTLLALAVSSATLPISAETLTLANIAILEVGTYHGDPVTISGSYLGSAVDQNRLDAIELRGVTFQNGLTIDASITVGSSIDDLVYDNADGVDMGEGTVIHTGLTINGNITVDRLLAAAANFEDTSIWGNLVNNANLSAKGEPWTFLGEDEEVARGLEFSGSQSAVDSLINNGNITAEGTRARGIFFLDSNLLDVINHGTVAAIGSGANGIHVDNAFLYAITNDGTISGENFGIYIDGLEAGEQDHEIYIEQNGGLISGGQAAIQANGRYIGLDWKGGKIQGDILGLGTYMTVENNVEFDGARIETAEAVEVGGYSSGNPGHLELLQAHTVIDGNLWVSGNSSLGLNLSGTTPANTPLLDVSGLAEFDQGAQIKLTANGTDFSAQGNSYTLIQAGSIDDSGLSVSSSSTLLNVDTFQVSGTQVIARVTTKSATEVGEVIASGGASSNAQAAGAAFSGVVINQLAQSAPNDPVRLAFIAASEDPVALAALAEQLVPEVSGSSTQAALTGQNLIANAAGNRTSSTRQGQSSGDMLKGTGVWLQALYSDADQDLRDGVAGYNAYSRGIAVGADGKLNEQFTVGLAYSLVNTGVNGEAGNKTEVDGHALTLYSGFEQGSFFLDGSLTYGLNDNSGKREIAGTTAKGDYDSDLLGLNLIGGYSYRMSDELLVEPRLAARYSQVNIDGYREKGSSAALTVEDQRFEVGELGAGVRLAGNFPLGQGTLEPQATLMTYHDFIADQAASTSTFVLGGTPFVSTGAKPARTSYEAAVGVDYHLGAVTLGASYNYLGKTDFNADTFSAKVRYDF